jgi:HK97 family phage prohead protease
MYAVPLTKHRSDLKLSLPELNELIELFNREEGLPIPEKHKPAYSEMMRLSQSITDYEHREILDDDVRVYFGHDTVDIPQPDFDTLDQEAWQRAKGNFLRYAEELTSTIREVKEVYADSHINASIVVRIAERAAWVFEEVKKKVKMAEQREERARSLNRKEPALRYVLQDMWEKIYKRIEYWNAWAAGARGISRELIPRFISQSITKSVAQVDVLRTMESAKVEELEGFVWKADSISQRMNAEMRNYLKYGDGYAERSEEGFFDVDALMDERVLAQVELDSQAEERLAEIIAKMKSPPEDDMGIWGDSSVEIRSVGEGKKQEIHITGYVPYETNSLHMCDIHGCFHEQLMPGVFGDSIKSGKRIMALWGHDVNKPIGNTENKSLRVWEQPGGLSYDILIDSSISWAKDALEAVKSGLVTNTSFGFRVLKDKRVGEGKDVTRQILKGELLEVSPVTFPAYPSAVVTAK